MPFCVMNPTGKTLSPHLLLLWGSCCRTVITGRALAGCCSGGKARLPQCTGLQHQLLMLPVCHILLQPLQAVCK